MRWDEFYRSEKGSERRSGDGTFAEVPTPSAGCEWIELFRSSTSRATRLIPAASWTPGPIVLLFKDERKAELGTSWKPDRLFIFWKRPSPQVLLTWPTSPRWTTLPVRRPVTISQPLPRRTWSVEEWLRCVGGKLPPEIPERPSDNELARRKYGPSVGMKLRIREGWFTLVRPTVGNRLVRKPWPEKWRTERKMLDTTARLKMHDYGAEGLINAPRMRETAYRNFYQAWKDRSRACGIVSRQNFWPWGDSVPRGSTKTRWARADAGECVTVDKGDPFRRAREIERRRREIPESHYQAWLSGGEVTVYLDCVLPSGRPNFGAVEARKDG